MSYTTSKNISGLDTSTVSGTTKVPVQDAIDTTLLSSATITEILEAGIESITDIELQTTEGILYLEGQATGGGRIRCSAGFAIQTAADSDILFKPGDDLVLRVYADGYVRVNNRTGGIVIGEYSGSPCISSSRDNALGALTVKPAGGDAPGSIELFSSGTETRSHFLACNTTDPNNFGAVELECDDLEAWIDSESKGTGTAPTLFRVFGFDEGIQLEEPTTIYGTSALPTSTGTDSSAGLRVGYDGGNGVLDFGQNGGNHGWIQSTNKTDLSSTYNFVVNPNGGNVGINQLYPKTALDVKGAITSRSLSADPSDPNEGASVTWTSDGTGSGDAGDVMMKITSGAVTKTVTLVDFSAS